MEKKQQPTQRKKTIALFIIMVFPIMMAMTSAIEGIFVRLFFQVVLFFGEYLVVSSFLDDYYNYYKN